MDDNPGFPAAFLGAMRIGAVPVPVNPLYGADDYPYFVEDSGARLAIVDAVCAEKVRAPKLLLVDELEPSEELQPVDTLRDDVAFWLYSSGSTGRPKGVVHLHRDLLYTAETYAPARPRDHRRGRHALDDEALPCVRSREQPLLSVLGGCDDGTAQRSADAGCDLRGGRAVPSHAVLLGTDALQRDARGRERWRLFVGEAVRVGCRAPPRRGLEPVERSARARHPRRHRLDRDAPHLLLEHRRGRCSRLERPAGARVRREARRRRRRRDRRTGIRRSLRPGREHAPRVLEPAREDGGQHPRRVVLLPRPVSTRQGRSLLVRGTRRRHVQGERPMGLSRRRRSARSSSTRRSSRPRSSGCRWGASPEGRHA